MPDIHFKIRFKLGSLPLKLRILLIKVYKVKQLEETEKSSISKVGKQWCVFVCPSLSLKLSRLVRLIRDFSFTTTDGSACVGFEDGRPSISTIILGMG